MKTVIQSDVQGCWLACVSMLTEVAYNTLKSRYKFKTDVTGRSAGPIVKLLDELGYSCPSKSTKISSIGSLSNLNADALVYFKNVDDDGTELGGHWMVWDHAEGVMRDPEGWKAGTCFRIKNYRRVELKS